ncbi:hypothetical protein [Bifidobacterium gallicum]|uniref:Uncharacterized protein n=1 Tax=Bifidobacterium gallicum DSM 20093 = LMG 11596 TaxID=561180 RepID=D1NTR6_9BIFI|nr:hypothetical protein [Bifidobacterium gallicum]EFA23120.1 hypothetical protein BIFGAL_03232 [Bifidobacterium gallicum DSM 20093 = LMG 11596]KFI58799.1 hypothetical protein BGLCM_1093 [Bifidobacterium gallicum DSM 20093 = LMG 11596]
MLDTIADPEDMRHCCRPSRLPVFDGVLTLRNDGQGTKFHITAVMPNLTEGQAQAMAQLTSRITCLCAEVLRGHQPFDCLELAMTEECLDRLETYGYLITEYVLPQTSYDGVFAQAYPPIPLLINGMFTDERQFSASVLLGIGNKTCWCTFAFRNTGSRWVCTVADMG